VLLFSPESSILLFPSLVGEFNWFPSSSGRSSFVHKTAKMKSSIQVILFFLLGLVASLAIPFKRQSPTQFTLVDFSGGAVRACFLGVAENYPLTH
jgi:hypothetical protein